MALVSFVEAIERGKIVRVPLDYARREGLLIVKQIATEPLPPPSSSSPSHSTRRLLQAPPAHFSSERLVRKGILQFDTYRRPLRQEDHTASLQENFHWELQRQRKLKGMTRKQVAHAVSLSEEAVKQLELGIVGKDFVALHKLESYYQINVRKGGSYLPQTPQGSVPPRASSETIHSLADTKAEELVGSDIALFEDEVLKE